MIMVGIVTLQLIDAFITVYAIQNCGLKEKNEIMQPHVNKYANAFFYTGLLSLCMILLVYYFHTIFKNLLLMGEYC